MPEILAAPATGNLLQYSLPMTTTPLPIDEILPELLRTVAAHPCTLLSAPPGAGKTTRVPLALLSVIPPEAGRILMLEPRRIAAVAAARYMADSLGEPVGRTVGYAVRFERKASPDTRIEVLTEGMLTRRLQEDPALSGVACVIFDEFHERSINADLGLALCREVQEVLRNDLKLLIMSATLDTAPLARLLGDAPLVVSEGRSYPVEVRYPDHDQRLRLPQRMAAVIRRVLATEQGDLLAFLPGSGEIRAVERELADCGGVRVCPLYGDLPLEQQRRAILPGPERRVVLATSIAETSLTIDGVRLVVDCGLSRRQQHDPASGLDRLVTVRSSRASALQRTGRAGRTGPGICFRLFSAHNFSAMTPHTPPEILTADLAPLLLELAAWGAADPRALPWLDPPPETALAAAAELLRLLGALDRQHRITELGREMVRYPLHPRLARLLLEGTKQDMTATACRLAALLSVREPLPAGQPVLCDSDLTQRLEQPLQGRRERSPSPALRIEQQLLQIVGSHNLKQQIRSGAHDLAPLLLAAWPDRLARKRSSAEERFLLATGRGATLSPRSGVRNRDLLVALQVDAGSGSDGVIHLASAVTEAEVRELLAGQVATVRRVQWDEAAGRVTATAEERLGAVVLAGRPVKADDTEALPLLLEQVRRMGVPALPWSAAARQLQGRVCLAHRLLPEEGWPDLSDARLTEQLEAWLGPHLAGLRSRQDLERLEMLHLLKETIGWNLLKKLNDITPTQVTVPSGRSAALDYTAEEGPVLAVKLQELFGLAATPTVCRGRCSVLVHLLSPAGRPVAVTRDLAGFWERGYLDVRKELRGRYPKHPWPDDPGNAPATHRTKRAVEQANRNGR
ncbi:ATP-dependent RNA helicase HrpB [Trichlorobacter ammonificans]|uniref:ATP-dependent RNA helicase HrpB n=2 Tax=Trichlorobacter ammonificans TaxID=2916410 RepID=A0ABN8HEL5_9BACT|nr:ATP-dependent RNA helicase HrpB [Trichlorobacter ammonificans]